MTVMGPHHITEEGLRSLEEQLERLVARRPELVERLIVARRDGELSENTGLYEAQEEQAALEARIAEIRAILSRARVIATPKNGNTVQLGSRVTVLDQFGETVYRIVGSLEADPASGRISVVSPVGRALLGAHPGDVVVATTPEGSRSLEVRKVA